MNKPLSKILLIAGEPSGDLLGAKLMKEFKLILPEIKFIGVGGQKMSEEGLVSLFAMEDLTVMGFVEVVKDIPNILKRIKQTADYIRQEKPEIVITIDSPDFCFRVIKKIQDLVEIKKVHMIAPSVWAYREGRAKKIAKLYNLLLAILPFEPPYFEKYGLKTIFIGHPIIEKKPDFTLQNQLRNDFRLTKKIASDDFVICLTPGSRSGEVKKIFPEFILAINKLAQEKNNLKVVIPLVKKTEQLVAVMAKDLNVEYFLTNDEEKSSAYFASDFALAKSGTNTIELSLYRIAIIVCYKVNLLSFIIAKLLVKIKFANLINIISNRQVIPELLQYDCNSKKILEYLRKFVNDKNLITQQLKDCQEALKIMGLDSQQSASKKAIQEILELTKK